MDQFNTHVGSRLKAEGSRLNIALAIVASVAVAVVVGVSLLLPQVSAQTEAETGEGAKNADVITRAELAKIERSLDEVLASQQQVLQRFEAIMVDLNAIKVRSSGRASVGTCTPCP